MAWVARALLRGVEVAGAEPEPLVQNWMILPPPVQNAEELPALPALELLFETAARADEPGTAANPKPPGHEPPGGSRLLVAMSPAKS